jgi:voltage-gated potassium channel
MGDPLNPFLRLVKPSVAILSVLGGGTLGYRYIEGWNWLDALYMTVISVMTVGYGETHPLETSGRIFTIFLLLTAGGVFAYSLTVIGSVMMEAQFGTLVWRRRMDAKIEALSGHYIICGYGRTDSAVSDPLRQAGKEVVVIEGHAERMELLQSHEVLFIEGDATHDDLLIRAGIKRAKGLVAALGEDAENVYLVLSARQLNPALTIVAWASSAEAERKVLRAGANHAISPFVLGGVRISHLLLSPHALEFLDHAMGLSDRMRLGEIEISPDSSAVGRSLVQMGMKRDLGVIIIGIRRSDGTMDFNPGVNAKLAQGDVLIGMGSPEQIEKLRELL